MNSTEAKIALLQYCRFARQYHYVATEVSIGDGLADVLASDGKNLVEYEIKISLSDLLGDKKKPKHTIYDPAPIVWDGNVGTKKDMKIELIQGKSSWKPTEWSVIIKEGDNEYNVSGWGTVKTVEEAKEIAEKEYGSNRGAPNTLYYVIPTWLWEKSQEKILASLHDSYGIITFEDHNYHKLTVVKKAKKLHKNSVSEGRLRTIVARMSSELATLTNYWYISQKEITEIGKRVEEKLELEDEDEG